MIPANRLPLDDAHAATLPAHWLYRIGGAAALIQLVCAFMTLIVVIALGGEPSTANEYFTVLQNNRLEGILRLDLFSLLNVSLFAFTAFALFAAFKPQDRWVAGLGTALVFAGIAAALATHSAFSMIHLSDLYAEAASAAEQAQVLAAGTAVIASDWWHSSGGLMFGLLLQGGMVLLSFMMLGNSSFHRYTAYAGLLANGLDFLHIIVGLFLPGVGVFLLAVGGTLYLVWYPLLARDLFRLARRPQ